MSTELTVRRLLPQNPPMQNFTFTPASFLPRENQKNYVFVDEHNRHKRLKVMRACEGCRRRKIKCDAATTNTWPCSACIRLKLHCVPPTVNYEGGTGQDFEQAGIKYEYESGSGGDDDYDPQYPLQQQFAGPPRSAPPVYAPQIPYSDNSAMYQQLPFNPPPPAQGLQYQNMHNPYIDNQYTSQTIFQMPPTLQHTQSSASPEAYTQSDFGEQDLADILGDLKMDNAGSAPYLSVKKKKDTSAEEPAFEEVDAYKHALPPIISGPDMKIRIPPELMPDEATALGYIDMYFDNVHPYVPVLNRTLFYQQWHHNRESISPLILEGIFAIAGKLTDEPSQGQQWLALAGKHADSFMDVPRLSTLQAMLILLKAREAAPKKGYYYRSWMSIVQCVAMGKDLGLDEHYADHKAGKSCGSGLLDCITKTRIWQACFFCELMIGSPQGRTDLAVDQDTVDLSIPPPIPGEELEYNITRNFTYFTRIINYVRTMNRIYATVKSKKDWGLAPELSEMNPKYEGWLRNLPMDLHVDFPRDGSLPYLPSHFIGNMHSYYYLGLILLHRPQLNFMDPSTLEWKEHMVICYRSAKYLCRIQEAILQQFGMLGLLCMQRGASYTIYGILTCTVLHLVCLTSPDPDLNSDARDFFTRHMRILEKCTSYWPMPEMQQKIDALREAFSADTRKPFVLKPSFPYGSPGNPNLATPPQRPVQYRSFSRSDSLDQQQPLDQLSMHSSVSYTRHPITPPITVSSTTSINNSPALQSLGMMAGGQQMHPQQQQQQPAMTMPMVDASTWNPSRIFDQWNTTFGTPSAPTQGATGPAQVRLPTSTSSPGLDDMSANVNLSMAGPSQAMPTMFTNAALQSYVSPSMWQESVASVYEGGLKRQWDYDPHGMADQAMKRQR